VKAARKNVSIVETVVAAAPSLGFSFDSEKYNKTNILVINPTFYNNLVITQAYEIYILKWNSEFLNNKYTV